MISWRRLFRRGQSDTVLQQEIELHLAEEIAENIERGIPADEARRQAFLKFGSPRRCARSYGSRIRLQWWIPFGVICARCFDASKDHRLSC